MPAFKRLLLTKGEFREMIARWMRNPKITARQFLELAAMYDRVSNKRTRMMKDNPDPTPEDLDDLVLKLEAKEKKNG